MRITFPSECFGTMSTVHTSRHAHQQSVNIVGNEQCDLRVRGSHIPLAQRMIEIHYLWTTWASIIT